MAFDAFLKIDGIEGESSNNKHKGEIEVLSFSWNIKQSIAGGGAGGGGAGKAEVSDFNIVKHIDKASPALMVAVCSGEHFRDAMFTVEEPRGGRGFGAAFLKIKLSDVLISSFQTGGGGGDQPLDQVSLAFAKVEIAVRDARGQWTQAESCDFARNTTT
jgi:type VI secretion system secreted protein Hcp